MTPVLGRPADEVRPLSDAPLAEPSRRGDASRGGRGTLRTVAPLDTEMERAGPVIVHAVSVTVSGGRASTTVEVRRGGEQSLGMAEGPCGGGAIDRLVAEATVRAAGGIEHDADLAAVEAVTVAPAGPRTVVTAVLARPLAGGDEPLVGVAAVGAAGVADAVARAVIDALARRSASP